MCVHTIIYIYMPIDLLWEKGFLEKIKYLLVQRASCWAEPVCSSKPIGEQGRASSVRIDTRVVGIVVERIRNARKMPREEMSRYRRSQHEGALEYHLIIANDRAQKAIYRLSI